MGQSEKRETMTQAEIDALLRHIERGESPSGPAAFESAEAARRVNDNFKQLQRAVRRCIEPAPANVGREEMAARLAQVHYYAHRNWYLKRGFASGKEFREFMKREAAKKGAGGIV